MVIQERCVITIEFLKPPIKWPGPRLVCPGMPFTQQCSPVASVPENLRKNRNLLRQALYAIVGLDAESDIVPAAEETGARGRAQRTGHITRGELHPGLGKTIDVRRGHHLSHQATHITISEIIHHHHNYVWLAFGSRLRPPRHTVKSECRKTEHQAFCCCLHVIPFVSIVP
jgi:hypothetical protein